MSKLSEYSKFDHIGEDDSDEENNIEQQQRLSSSTSKNHHAAAAPSSLAEAASSTGGGDATSNPATRTRKDEKTGRFVFEYNGSRVYEWEQSLDDVTIYVVAPPFVKKGNQLKCRLTPHRLQLGLQSNQQWFINEETFGTIDVSESTWSLEEDETNKNADGSKQMIITIYLTKAHRGQLWEGALKGNQAATANGALDPHSKEQVQKELLLERFQEENPGMDFRGAEFNGSVPDARTFMGGVKYR